MHEPAAPSAIVVADALESFELLRECVTSAYALQHAGTVDQARQLITAETPLVLCGCHFDDGRMYDLLRSMKATAGLAQVPFLAIRVLEGGLDDTLYESVKIATRALGADGFVDLFRWQRRYGAAEAAHRLTQRIEALAGSQQTGSI